MSRLTIPLFLVAAALFACRGADQPAPGAAPPALPPTDVKTVTLAAKPIAAVVRVRRDASDRCARPPSSRRSKASCRQIFVSAGDRVRAGQPLVQIDPDRQQATVVDASSRSAPRARRTSRYAQQQLARMQKLFEAGAVSLRRAGAGGDGAQERRGAARPPCSRRSARARCELQYYRVTAPAAGIVGEIPIRRAIASRPATVITTIDQAEGLEAYINVPLERASDLQTRADRRAARRQRRRSSPSNPITFIAPRADDATQSVLVKATLRQSPPGLRVHAVRARADHLEQRAGADGAGGRGQPHRPASISCSSPRQREQGFVARQKPVTRRRASSATTTSSARPRRPASASSCRTSRRSATARRSTSEPEVRLTELPCSSTPSSAARFWRPSARWSSCWRARWRSRPCRSRWYPEVAPPHGVGDRGLHRRQRRDGRDRRHHAARAGDQRRRGHALHVLVEHQQRRQPRSP